MLKNWLIIFCLGFFHLPSNAQAVKGLDASETIMFYASGTHLYAQDLRGGTEIQKAFRDDTLFNQYLLKIAENFGHDNDAENKARLNAFEVMNLTWNNNHLYMCLRYLHKNVLGRLKPRFGFVAFDENLNAINYFSIQTDTGITNLNIWPYHPLEFKDDTTIYLQYFHSNVSISEFKLNFKKHRVVRAKQNTKINIDDSLHYNFLANPAYMMSPAVYMVPRSGNRLFFIHPFPIIFNTANAKIQADPFNLIGPLHKTYNLKKDDGYAGSDFSSSLGIAVEKARSKNIIMTSRQWNDSVFAIVSSSNANECNLLFFEINDKKCNVKNMNVAAGGNAYFILRRNRLYQLNFKDSKGIITSHVIR